jgi:tRNA U34 5-methylaminomethyl-2-thiouridine-forming methyltransferase MnmC
LSELEGGWRPERTADGSWTLAHPVHGEWCHSRAGAWSEAVERYVRPCRLGERIASGELGRVRLLDVGTGLGVNVAAALDVTAPAGVALDVVSLEAHPDVIRATLSWFTRRADDGPGAGARAAVRSALAAGLAARGGPVPLFGPGAGEPGPAGSLRLLLGDARATIGGLAEERCDAVFLDPFSPSREPALWEPGFLAQVARRLAPGSWLSTYSAAFAVRAALFAAGLRVGAGPPVGNKAEGTLASPDREPPALPRRVRERLARER